MSVFAILFFHMTFKPETLLYMIASLIGVTALIFLSKANPIGQVLTIIFAVFYGVISYSFAYYGEMITYLFMTAPIALIALVSWLKHPFKGHFSEVEINEINQKEYLFIIMSGLVITVIFYFVLEAFNTNNLVISTISIFTSFLAVYLTVRRSRFYALFYAMNDLVLIILWTLAAITNISYVAIVICFLAFLVMDMYGFINWSRLYKIQKNNEIK